MLKMTEIAIPTKVYLNSSLSLSPSLPISFRTLKKKRCRTKSAERYNKPCIGSAASSSQSFHRTLGVQHLSLSEISNKNQETSRKKKRVFFLDVNPLCYAGSTPCLHTFGFWVSLFFSQVSLNDPVIAVLDGEGGGEHRRKLMPSYKAHRRRFFSRSSSSQILKRDHSRRSEIIRDILTKCNVPVIKIEGHEADDVVATLVGQVLQKGHKAVVASPDKDFKQLVSEHVQIVLPVAELQRWSFYTIKHYIAQYKCDPCSDLSLRCIMGDEVDGVPGIQSVVPGFGRKTALKLLKKHGSLENLLKAAAVRTVAKEYAQNALREHANYLRRNYQVLALRRDVDVHLQEEWLVDRDNGNDSVILSKFLEVLEERKMQYRRDRSSPSCG